MATTQDTTRGCSGDLFELISAAVAQPGGVILITGAGVSAESGIRTYRGDDGLWTTEGAEAMSRATAAFYYRHPRESWQWYLVRRTLAQAAEPNGAHHAIVEMERALGERFTLVTQNVDRLHIRAGSSPAATIEIHGHLHGMRCSGDCDGVTPIPDVFDEWTEDHALEPLHLELLTCPTCGLVTRPHVLWFDEFYDQAHYRIQDAQSAVARAALCITVGTSGGVPIAERLAHIAARAGATLIDVNPNDNALRRMAHRTGGGSVDLPAATGVPLLGGLVAAAVA